MITGEPNIKREAISKLLDEYYRKCSESSWCPSAALDSAVITLTGPWSLKGDVDDLYIEFHAMIEWEHTDQSFYIKYDWNFPFIHPFLVRKETEEMYCVCVLKESDMEWLIEENFQNNGSATDWSII